MSIMTSTARFFNLLYVEQRKNTIYVMNVDGLFIQSVIKKMYEKTKLAKYIFTYVGGTFFSFNAFFAPDFVFVLTKLMASEDVTWKSRMIYERIINQIYTNTWMVSVNEKHKDILDFKQLSKFRLRPYGAQLEFLKTFDTILPRYGLRGYLLAGAPGSGKSLADLMVSACLVPRELAEVTIIISPKNALHLVWDKSIKTLFYKPPTAWFSDSDDLPTAGYDFYVFNFDAIEKAVALGRVLRKQGIKFFVVVDESHNFNELTAQRTHQCVELCTLCPESYFLWASGSPVKAMGREMIPFLRGSDPRFDADAEKRFYRIFNMNAGLATEIFHHRFGQMMAFKIPRSAFMKQEPIIKFLPVILPVQESHKFLVSTIRVDMRTYMQERIKFYESNLKTYRAHVKKCFSFFETSLTDATQQARFELYKDRFEKIQYDEDDVTPAMRTWCRTYERETIVPVLPADDRQGFLEGISVLKSIKHKVLGETLGNVVEKRREECALALALHCNAKKIIDEAAGKTMFFASNTQPLIALDKLLTSQGFHPLLAIGATAADFTQRMNTFATDKLINPILATYKFLSEAIPVTEANTIVLINRPYRQYIWEQAIARALRIGQTRQVYIIEVTLDTGDEMNISTRTDIILQSVRHELRGLIGPEFAGPAEAKREVMATVDASDAEVLPQQN